MINLHQYQIDARNWVLSKNNAGLFLPPGLGKTAIMLSTIKLLRDANAIDRVLIIAPLRVAHVVWPSEIKKWGFDLSIGVLHGPDKDTIVRQKHDVYVVNPEGMKWLIHTHRKLFEKYRFMLICDESTLFKTHSSQRFKLLKSILPLFIRRVILTGTPSPNGLIQLWSQIFILDRGKRLGTGITKYRNKWFTKNFSGFGYAINDGSDVEIYSAIEDIVMHKSNDELNLPPLVFSTILVELPGSVVKQYMAMKEEFIFDMEGMDKSIIAVNAATKGAKLKQIANGVVYDEDKNAIAMHDEKLRACDELIDSLAGSPLMIVYEYLHDLDRLKERYDAPHIGGGTSGDELNAIVAMWNSGDIPILLIQPQAAGHGLNLQDGGCHDVVHYSISFDLELYEQVNARVYRQGVKNSVTIHHLAAKGTIDIAIMKALDGKSSVQKALLNSLIR